MTVRLLLATWLCLAQDSDLFKKVEEAASNNKYEEALAILSDSEKAAIKAKDAESVYQIREHKKAITALKAEYAKVKEADAKLASGADDPDANAAMGRFYCFVKEDWSRGLPLLAKGSDQFLQALADQELNKSAKGEDKVLIGDGWWTGSTEAEMKMGLTGAVGSAKVAVDKEATKRAKSKMIARAVYWYQQAWPQIKEAAREKLRPRFRALYVNPTGQDPKGLKDAPGWTSHKDQNAGPSARASHSGKNSWEVVCGKNALERYTSLSQIFVAQPGKAYEFSCWALTDGTEAANDEINFPIFSADGKLVLHPLYYLPVDGPYWQKIEIKFVCPDTAARVTMGVVVTSRKGLIFLDDLSLRCEGRELIKNTGFEDK